AVPAGRHLPGIRALELLAVAWCFATRLGAVFDGLEEGSRPASSSGARSVYSGEVALQRVMKGYLVELAAFFLEPYPQPVLLWKIAPTFMPQAAQMRANVRAIAPIRARSQSPRAVWVAMERSSLPASSTVGAKVLLLPSFCRGARIGPE